MKSNSSAFDYTYEIKMLCKNICLKIKQFNRYDLDRVGFSFVQARNNTRNGEWADITPLRFRDGALACYRETRSHNGDFKRMFFKAQRVISSDLTEYLYVFNIVVPRFVNLPTFSDKLTTIMHELYHISPEFNGDVRRFPGRNWKHGSNAEYDKIAKSLAQQWLATDPDPRLFEFLRYDLQQLTQLKGRVIGSKLPRIRLIPIDEEEALQLNPSLYRNKTTLD